MDRKLGGLILGAAILASTSANAKEPEILELSPDTYMVIVKNYAGVFGNPQTTKVKAIKAANEFAARQGKIAIPLSYEYTPAGGPGHWPAGEYQFRAVAKGDSEAGRVSLARGADTRIEITSTSAPAATATTPRDVYTELLKLDDLRKRGIITDSEFEAQKRILLSQ